MWNTVAVMALVAIALCAALSAGAAFAHESVDVGLGVTPGEIVHTWWSASGTIDGINRGATNGPSSAEASAISDSAKQRLLDGTAQVSRLAFTGAFGNHAATGSMAPTAMASEWTLIEGAAADVDSSCNRVDNGGSEREIIEIFSVRSDGSVFIVHELLESTNSRMHAIYHPGDNPAIPHTAANSRTCAFLEDRNDHAGQRALSASSLPAGTSMDRIVISFREPVVARSSLSELHSQIDVLFCQGTGSDGLCVETDLVLGESELVAGPILDREFVTTLPELTLSLPGLGIMLDLRDEAASSGTDPFWFSDSRSIEIDWDPSLSDEGFLRTVDIERNPVMGIAPTPDPMLLRDALPPAPTMAVTGSGTGESPYVQDFSEAPAGDATSVFAGVSIVKTDAAGVRTEITDAAVTGMTDSRVSFTSATQIAATDHIEYVGISDAAGNTAARPAIVSVERLSPTVSTVGFSMPVSGTTAAAHWFISGSGTGESRARAVAVAAGVVEDPVNDATPDGSTPVTVALMPSVTVEHLPILAASTVTIEYAPPAAHASYDARFDGRLAASGLRVEATDTPITATGEPHIVSLEVTGATLDSTTQLMVSFSTPISGTTSPQEWSIAGEPAASVSDGTESASGSQTLTIAPPVTSLTLVPATAQAGDATPAVTYGQPTGQDANRITDTATTPTALASITSGLEAVDRARPTVTSQAFAGQAYVDVTFSEPVRTSGTWTSTTLGAISASAGVSANTVWLRTANLAALGSTHTITVPGEVRDRALVPNAVDLSDGATITLTSTAAPDSTPPTISSAVLTSARTVTVTMSEAVRGTPNASQWRIGSSAFGSIAQPSSDTITLTRNENIFSAGPTGLPSGGASLSYSGSSIHDLSGNDLAAVSGSTAVALVDEAPPEATSAAFLAANNAQVSFTENIAVESGAVFEIYDVATGGTPVTTATSAQSPNMDLILSLNPPISEEKTYYIDLAGVTDTVTPGNAYASTARQPITYDTTAPTATVQFAGTRVIKVVFDDELASPGEIGIDNFEVSVPDNTLKPDDSGSAPDLIALAGIRPVSYDAESRTATLTLRDPAIDGVTYTVTPMSIDNIVGRSYLPETHPSVRYLAPFEAERVTTETIGMRFRAALAGDIMADQFRVVDSDGAMTARPVSGVSVDATTFGPAVTLPADRIVHLRLSAALSSAASTPFLAYTSPASGGLTEGAMPLPAGEWTLSAVGAMPPTFTAAFTGARTIVLTASEPLDASKIDDDTFAVTVPDGADDGSEPDVVELAARTASVAPVAYDEGSMRATLTLAADAIDDVTYTITSSTSVTDALGVPHDGSGTSVRYADTYPPTVQDAAFEGAMTINVTFDEPVRIPAGTLASAWTVVNVADRDDTLAVSAAMVITANTRVIALTVPAATDGVTYEISVPTAVTDTSTAQNAVAASTTQRVTYTAPPTITAAQLDSAGQVTLTMSKAVSGTVTGSEWMVGTAAFDGGSISETDATRITLTRSSDIFATSPTAVPSGAVVAYSGMSINSNGAPLAAGNSPAITDAARPTFGAQVNDNAQVAITFSEPVRTVSGRTVQPYDFSYHTKDDMRYASIVGNVRGPGATGDDAGADLDAAVFPTSHAFDPASPTQATLQFGGTVSATVRAFIAPSDSVRCDAVDVCAATMEMGDRLLLTSMPTIAYTHTSSSPLYEDLTGLRMENRTTAVSVTDNASPVAFAAFEDANTIIVRFSEEMATPSNAVLGNVAVTGPGGPATVSGTPMFTPHTAATNDDRFVQPRLEITLDPAAAIGSHTVSFDGFAAAAGPSGKMSVANAMATNTHTVVAPPSFAAATRSATTTLVTFDGGSLGGTLNTSNWAVTDNDTGGASVRLDIESVSTVTLDPDSSVSATPAGQGGSPAAATPAIPSSPAVTRLLITHAPLSSTAATPQVSYTAGSLTEGGSAILSDSEEASDGAPPVASNARFDAAGDILVTLSEPIATPPASGYTATPTGAITGNSLGTLRPDYTAGSMELKLLTSSDPAVESAVYTLRLPALVDTASPMPNTQSTLQSLSLTVQDITPPMASSLAVTVADPAGQGAFTDRTGAHAHFANAGDRITISITFDEDVSGTPMITVPGTHRTATATGMGNAGDSNARTWSHSFTVNSADDEAALEFTIAADDTAIGANPAMITQAAITQGQNAIIDVTAPSLAAAGDALHTRARHAGTAADVTETAGIGAQVRLYVTATEALVTAAGDATFGTPPRPATTVEPADGTNAHVYYRTISESDAGGAVTFALTMRDRAGNTTELDQTNLTTARGAGTGHRVSVDTTRPTATAAFSGSAITVTFSEAVYGVPASLSVTRPGGSPTAMTADHTDGEATVRIAIATPVIGTWTVAIPDDVVDVARNARDASSASVAAERTRSPTATLISYTVLDSGAERAAPFASHARQGDTIRLAITLSEPVTAAPTVLFVGKPDPADAVTMDRQGTTNEWRAEYTVEAASAAPGIDGAFSFVATVTGNTGSMGMITPASYAQASPPTIDRVAPAIATAAFTFADTIVVTLSEPMAGTVATIEGYAYSVTAPDDTNSPADANSDVDVIALVVADMTAKPAAYSGGPPATITLTLADDAPADVAHTVTLPTQLTDMAGNAFADATEDATYDPPVASSLTFTVFSGSAEKSGTYELWAGIGNTVRIDLDLDADAAAPPLITLAGRGTTAVAMGAGTDVDASTWRHGHTVVASHAGTTDSAPFGISITVTGENGNRGVITPSSGLADGVRVGLPTIDTTRPALDEGNSLYTQTRYTPHPGPRLPTEFTTAGVGNEVWVVLDATEPLVTAALGDIGSPNNGNTPARADATFFAGTASGVQATSAVEDSATNHVYNYSRVIAAGDPEGPVAFSVTIRDRAGNEAASAITHADLATIAARDDDTTADPPFGYRAPVDSSVPSLASAMTASASTLAITLSEPLPPSATTIPADWEVVGSTLTVTGADIAGATVTLTYEEVDDTAFTPTLRYSGTGLADAGRNAVASGDMVTATDGVAPRALSAAFVSATEVHVTFSEAVTPGMEGWTVGSLGVARASPGPSSDIVALALITQATEGSVHDIGIGDASARDASGNAAAAQTITGVTYLEDAPYAATTARYGAQEYIRIQFAEAITGTTVAAEWFIGVDADADGGTAAAFLAKVCTPGGTPAIVQSVNLASLCPEVPEGQERTLYLAYEAPDSGATPRVAYRAPTGAMDTPLVLAADTTVEASTRAISAADGLAPLFEAATATRDTIRVTFDEDVTGTPDASRWYHYVADDIPPSQSELDTAVTAGTNFASATLSGRTLTLALPDSYAPASGWGADDTAAVPDTIGYHIPTGEIADIADTAAAPNGLAANTADDSVADGAPPEILNGMMEIVALDGGTAGAPKDIPGYAMDGDAIRVMLTVSEPSSTTTLPSLGAFGATTAMTLSNSDATATGAIAIPAGAREGAAFFAVTLTDAASPANTARFTQADLATQNVVIDNTAPELASLIRQDSSTQLIFSEPVHGTASITITPDGGAALSATATIPASAPRATATIAQSAAGALSVVITGLSDRAGNAIDAAPVTPEIIEVGGELVASEFEVPPTGAFTVVAPGGDRGPGGSTLLLLGMLAANADGNDEFGGDIVVRIAGATATFRAGTAIGDYGLDDTDKSLLVRLADAAASGYSGVAVAGDESAQRDNENVADALNAAPPMILVELGKAGEDVSVTFSAPVSVRLLGAGDAVHVFWLSGAAAMDVNAIQECVGTAVPPELTGTAECFVRDDDDIVIWTTHFTQFGASAQVASRGSSSGCDDCTPPTLGIDNTGTRRVTGGFNYNGDVADAEYYYTPLPLITVETGVENVAVLKVFEDSGPHNVRNVGLGFGLTRGQHFAESEAEIHVNIAFDGTHTITVDDPANAIDTDSLRAIVETGVCMEDSEAVCRIVTIHHTFREPLEFNVVSTIVWDHRRNAWQNFFNHGVEVTGESLNPSHGIEVNGGELVLYPLIAGHVDDDGDGIYDFDERHVTYMLDDEYRVYRLTPAGTYEPLRNLASLYHDVDESMFDETRDTKHGPARGTSTFEELIAEQRRIAEEVVSQMGLGAPEPDEPGFVPNAYDPAAERKRLEILRESIAAEINAAELAMERLYPLMARQ